MREEGKKFTTLQLSDLIQPDPDPNWRTEYMATFIDPHPHKTIDY